MLAWVPKFELKIELQGEKTSYILRTGDPIAPGTKPRRFDSLIEKHFVRDFFRASSEWEIMREPGAISTSYGLFFPDFSLVNKVNNETWFIEIVGFWTADKLCCSDNEFSET